jgi:hypothetical protein
MLLSVSGCGCNCFHSARNSSLHTERYILFRSSVLSSLYNPPSDETVCRTMVLDNKMKLTWYELFTSNASRNCV